MTRTKITLSYEEICDFSEPTVIRMEVPERAVEEMCEYFQRFLLAAGYVLEDNEHIGIVRKETKPQDDYPGCGGDSLTFSKGGVPFCYNFETQNTEPLDFGQDHITFAGSYVRGAYGEDLINLS